MREIADDLYTWSRLSEPHGYDFNGYFLRHAAGNLVIDPVEPEPSVVARLAAEGVARIVETALEYLEAPVRRVTGYDVQFPFFARERAFLPNAPRISQAARETLAS